MHHIKIITQDAIAELSKQMQCEDLYVPELTSKDFLMAYEEVKPIEGYQPPENFPNCCQFHKKVYDDAAELYEEFPNCCEKHKRLLSTTWFNKKDYESLPKKVVDTLSYTEFHIVNRINEPEWFKDITNYIEYCIQSFGQLPDGYGPSVGLWSYITNLKHFIKSRKDIIPEQKATMLVRYIEEYCRPHSIIEGASINILISIYKKWLKIFPFEIGYFRTDLKKQFENQVPILKGAIEHNPYSRISKAKIKSQAELIELLVNTTKTLLEKVKTEALLNNGIIPDIHKHTLHLINESHRLKQTTLLGTFSKGEIRYVKVLKQWLFNEKEYFKEIGSLIKELPTQIEDPNKQTNTEKLKLGLNKYAFFTLPKLKDLSEKSIAKLFEHLTTGGLPYQIAMFDFLGFTGYMLKEHCGTKATLFKKLAEILGVTDRAVKGNILVLSDYSKENKERYTAHLHKESVKKDYGKLK